MLFPDTLVLIKGAGDLASGVAYRLWRAGFPIVMTELPVPTMVRRAVSFGQAVYDGEVSVEGISARRVANSAQAAELARTGEAIPVLVDPEAKAVGELRPVVLVDAIVAKRNTGTRLNDAPLVIALGPGFTAGLDCHAVIETQRGHWLGRVLYRGSAQPNTGTPGEVLGHNRERVLRAPAAGQLRPLAHIGDRLKSGDVIGYVGHHALYAPFDGVLRGLIHPQVMLTAGFKIGDLDPRANPEHCFTISDKALALGGAVLEAILVWMQGSRLFVKYLDQASAPGG